MRSDSGNKIRRNCPEPQEESICRSDVKKLSSTGECNRSSPDFSFILSNACIGRWKKPGRPAVFCCLLKRISQLDENRLAPRPAKK